MMSAKQDTSNNNIMMSCCASCGTSEGDGGIQLKDCTACGSVQYCSDACQELHLPEHAGKCRKRAAELRDELLFRQPESSHRGDCPICQLPFPLDINKCVYHSCCSKVACMGCVIANMRRLKDERLEHSCPFCRDVTLTSDVKKMNMKRIQANDPSAICQAGTKRFNEGKFLESIQHYSKAAELGDAEAHFKLAIMYRFGQGVEKDEKKEIYHLEEAAIKGHPDARYQLGITEGRKGREDRAEKHLIIAANLGHDQSLQTLKELYKTGSVSKEDFASTLRAHRDAVIATKSPQREAAEQGSNK